MRREVCAGPMTRRDVLRAGMLTLGGLTLPQVLAGRAAAGNVGNDAAVILLYLHGGASHLETYDLKPHAPREYRSIFAPISTRVPGLDICELFPRQAELADKLAVIRSLHHDVGIHSDGGIVVLTGKRPSKLDPSSQSVSEHPDFGAVASRMLGPHAAGMPRHALLPQKLYMTRPAYAGIEHGPFEMGDPHAPNFAPPSLSVSSRLMSSGLDDRRTLIKRLDRLRNDLDQRQALSGTDEFRDRAFAMLGSRRVAEAFDLTRESESLRDKYGRNRWGQSCLLARRLAEAGASVVTVFLDTPASGPDFTNWDDHAANAGRPGHFGRYMRVRLPYYDQALSSLIEDVYARGRDRDILIVATGEFGRTPYISYFAAADAHGRDHWPQAYSALVSGGGLRMGQVIGATSSKGEHPVRRPCTPQDLLATMYRHLGIDYRRELFDYSGRPIPILAEGTPLPELLRG